MHGRAGVNGQLVLLYTTLLATQLRYAARANTCPNAILSQMPSQRVDEHCPLSHHQVAAFVEHQHRLLFDSLHRENRIVGRFTSSQLALASAASVFPRFTHGFT